MILLEKKLAEKKAKRYIKSQWSKFFRGSIKNSSESTSIYWCILPRNRSARIWRDEKEAEKQNNFQSILMNPENVTAMKIAVNIWYKRPSFHHLLRLTLFQFDIFEIFFSLNMMESQKKFTKQNIVFFIFQDNYQIRYYFQRKCLFPWLFWIFTPIILGYRWYPKWEKNEENKSLKSSGI
jgi:hypothetical protein